LPGTESCTCSEWKVCGSKLPNASGGGWRIEDANNLLNHTVYNSTIKGFDVIVIFCIPHGWIQLDDISKSNLYHTIKLAGSVFGAKKSIFVSIPFSNNVQSIPDMIQFVTTNSMIQQFVYISSNWNTTAVESVEMLEFRNFVKDSSSTSSWA
jgi:uncharacterized membrane protein YjfL (UPF0719 family)